MVEKTASENPLGMKIISILFIIIGVCLAYLSFFVYKIQETIFLEYIAAIPVAGACISFFFVGIALWKGKKWAIKLARAIAIAGFMIGILMGRTIPIPIKGIIIIISVAIGSYLFFNKDVKTALE